MRLLMALAVAASLVLMPAASAQEAGAHENKRGDGVEYSGKLPGKSGGQSQGRGGGGAAAPVTYKGYGPTLGTNPDGTQCVTTEAREFPTPQAALDYENSREQAWMTLLRQYPLCPDAALPQADPAVLAAAFWGEVLLAKPAPYIAPGFAVTGKRAYLETNAPTAQSFTRDTPLGPVTIAATGSFLVNWGDGTTTGPHGYPGEPWPHGRITHAYTDTGTVDVVVTEAWTATWSLAGRSGTLTELRTEGRIDDFEVRQVQAVRNR